MNKTAYVLVALVALMAVPALAQGPFTDVPADHWAYDAANQLQKDGILIGYPDGTFQGKRTITRYEFAVALARIAEVMMAQKQGVSKQEVQDMLKDYQKIGTSTPSTPGTQIDTSKFATKDDVAAIRKMVEEFKDEIAALGVDVDALKRDVAALGARVDALEAEVKRVRFTGDVNVFAITENSTSPNMPGNQDMFDLDQRQARLPNDTMIRNIGLVKDFDLKIAGRVNNCITANATINYGDYLNYVAFVDDYVGGVRPTSKTTVAGTSPRGVGFLANNANADSLTDAFFPYYLSIDAALGKGSVTAGRFPLQFTPYTLRKIDVDSYTNILKTDDGNYPVDGAKVAYNFGGVDLTLFAVKNNENIYLINGLTGQPFVTGFAGIANGVLHQVATGNAVGGLTQVTQTAGGRATFNIPCNGTVGVTYYQAWDGNAYANAATFDQARVYGGDVAIPIPWVETLSFAGSWTRSDTLASTFAGNVQDVDYGNIAWDGRFSGNIAALNASAGYKNIGRNFAAAGAWDKIGRWTNPVDVKGPYADFNYPILDNLKVDLNGEYLTVKDTMNGVARWGKVDDTLTKAELGVKWGFTKSNALDVAYQVVRFNDKNLGAQNASENYLTVGLAHQMNPNAGVKIGYQWISYDNGTGGPYGLDYRGGLGVVQFGVTF